MTFTGKTLAGVALCAWAAGAYMQELYIEARQESARRRRGFAQVAQTWCAWCFNYKREDLLATGERCAECGRSKP